FSLWEKIKPEERVESGARAEIERLVELRREARSAGRVQGGGVAVRGRPSLKLAPNRDITDCLCSSSRSGVGKFPCIFSSEAPRARPRWWAPSRIGPARKPKSCGMLA